MVDGKKEQKAVMLTDTMLRSVKAGSPMRTDAAVRGLVFSPSTAVNGEGAWIYRYSSPTDRDEAGKSKRKKVTLGHYPAMGVKAARVAANSLLIQRQEGIDPKREQERVAREVEEAKKHTLAAVCEEYLTHNVVSWKGGREGQHYRRWTLQMKKHIFPQLGEMQINEISAGQLAEVLADVWQNTSETGTKLVQNLSSVWDFADGRGYVARNILRQTKELLPPRLKESEHYPSQDFNHIPAFVRVLWDKRGGLQGMLNSELLLLFSLTNAARGSATRLLLWEDVDFKSNVWTLKPERERSKVKREGRYPITTTQQEILREAATRRIPQSNAVFPAEQFNKASGWHLSDVTAGKILKDMRVLSTTPGRFATVHGWRASFTDWCVERGISESMTERQLQHVVKQKVRAAYERSDQLEGRRQLMQQWDDFCFSEVKK